MIPPEILLLNPVTPHEIAWVSRALTALVGLFVAGLAYRGFHRNDAPKMRSLAIGIFLLTTGVFLTVAVVTHLDAGTGLILLLRGLVTVVGLGSVLYALLYQ